MVEGLNSFQIERKEGKRGRTGSWEDFLVHSHWMASQQVLLQRVEAIVFPLKKANFSGSVSQRISTI